MKAIFAYVKAVAQRYVDHGISDLSAKTTYYLILALVPFLIVILSLIIMVAQHNMSTLFALLDYLPLTTKATLTTVIEKVLSTQVTGALSFSLLAALWSVSQATNALIDALNAMLGIDVKAISFFRSKVKSLLFTILGVGNILLGLSLTVIGQTALHFIGPYFNISADMVRLSALITTALPIIMMVSSLVLFYRYAPYFAPKDRHQWSSAISSACIATFLWVSISLGYRWYITHLATGPSTYGPMVGIMLLFVWLNLSVQAVLLGPEMVLAWQARKDDNN